MTRLARRSATRCALACIGAWGCERARPAPNRDHTADSAAVAAAVHARLDAALAGDTARWHRLVSDSALWSGAGLAVARTREVLPSVVANRAIRPAAQQIVDLAVYLRGDVAQAAYVQLVQDRGQAAHDGRRFRKVDTFVRRDGGWLLIGAAETLVPFRPRVALAPAATERLLGRFALGAVDTLAIEAGADGTLTMRGADGAIDTLHAENDSTLFTEGDAGSWVFVGAGRGAARALAYRAGGARDVTLTRVGPP